MESNKKLDFQFWKNVESHKGLSLRSLYVTFFVDVIILNNKHSLIF